MTVESSGNGCERHGWSSLQSWLSVTPIPKKVRQSFVRSQAVFRVEIKKKEVVVLLTILGICLAAVVLMAVLVGEVWVLKR